MAKQAQFTRQFRDGIELFSAYFLNLGIILCWIACLYFMHIWIPFCQDSRSKSSTDFVAKKLIYRRTKLYRRRIKLKTREKIQAQFEVDKRLIKQFSAAGLVAISLLIATGCSKWFAPHSTPADIATVLVADFVDEEGRISNFEDIILDELRETARVHDNIQIKLLHQAITKEDGINLARDLGIKRKANIIIWGWSESSYESISTHLNIEVLQAPKYLPKSESKLYQDSSNGEVYFRYETLSSFEDEEHFKIIPSHYQAEIHFFQEAAYFDDFV
ncbi:MAG: hypothetical protein F6K04_24355, partial [Leptolyngbya sp. SIO4C5]|nr:hypothetical protein [Leptolyngbya sp. SIO4C5]